MTQRLRLGFVFRAVLLSVALATTPKTSTAQSQQQYVYGSVPATAATSQVLSFVKNGSTGALSATSGSPFADHAQGGALAIDGQGHFLFILNPGTSNISMFQIDQTTGNLTQVAGSPFSMGPTETTTAASSPFCLATEASGQFVYVGYRFGNISGEGAINEFLIDATGLQLVALPGQPTTDIPSSPIGMLTDPKGLHLYVGLGANAATGAQDAGTLVFSIDSTSGKLALAGSAGNAINTGKSIAIDPQTRFFFDGTGGNLLPGFIDSALISPADGTATTGLSTVTLAPSVEPLAMLAESGGKFLYVQENTSPQVYSINQTTGALTPVPAATGTLTFNSGTAVTDPLGPYLYSLQSDGIHGFQIDPQTGSLAEISGSPFSIGPATEGMLTISGAPIQAASGPVAALFPPSVNFGSLPVGQTSNSQVVTLTNTGNQGLALNSLAITGTNASDFVATPNCNPPTVLAPNATCSISVAFSPTAVGLRRASLTAGDNATGNPQSVSLSGTGVAAQPAVTLAPGSLTFPATAQGSISGAESVTLTSAGDATLHIASVMLSGANPGDFVMMNSCIGAYAVNATCSISVTFSPVAAGQRLASIVITDDAPNSPQSVQLSGTGTGTSSNTPAVTLAPNAISFGAVTQGATATPQRITLTSSGTATLHIASVTLSGNNTADISLSNGCSAGAYAVNATCNIGVAFAPVALGTRAATISVADDAPNSPQLVSISATVNPALTIAPAASGGTSVSVSAGQTADFNLDLTPGPGFVGSVSFTCTGAPAAATCNASPVQLSGGTPVAYTVSVSTSGTAAGGPMRSAPLQRIAPRFLPVLASLLLAMLLLAIGRTTQRVALPRLVCAVLILAAGSVAEGCAGGSPASAIVQSPQLAITPQGTSTITLTPTVTTSGGKQLPGTPPIQLTLTVN